MFPINAVWGLNQRMETGRPVLRCVLSPELPSALGLGPAWRGAQETAPGACAARAACTPFGDIAPFVPPRSPHANSLGKGLSGLRAQESHVFLQPLIRWYLMGPEPRGIRFWPLESSEDNLGLVSCNPEDHELCLLSACLIPGFLGPFQLLFSIWQPSRDHASKIFILLYIKKLC